MIKCPKCGEEIETGAYFCSNCGTRVSAVCPKCGKKLKPDAKFCSGCGADLSAVEDEEQEENVCRHCGAKLEPDDEYCGECGKAVNDKKSDSVKKSGDSQRNTKKRAKGSSTESTEPFIMPIEDVFFFSGRGTVVTGRVKQGTACINDEVQITGLGKTIDTHIIGIEMFNKKLKKATAGDDVGLLLYGLEKEDVSRDQLVVTPGTVVDLPATYECNMEVEGIEKKDLPRLGLIPSLRFLLWGRKY